MTVTFPFTSSSMMSSLVLQLMNDNKSVIKKLIVVIFFVFIILSVYWLFKLITILVYSYCDNVIIYIFLYIKKYSTCRFVKIFYHYSSSRLAFFRPSVCPAANPRVLRGFRKLLIHRQLTFILFPPCCDMARFGIRNGLFRLMIRPISCSDMACFVVRKSLFRIAVGSPLRCDFVFTG